MPAINTRLVTVTLISTLFIATSLVGAQPSKPAQKGNPSLLLGKSFAEFDKFFGKPKQVDKYSRKAMIPGKSYTEAEMASLPDLPVEERYYLWKGIEVHAYKGATDKLPTELRFLWKKGKPKTWQEALSALSIPGSGVTATTSTYNKLDRNLKTKAWTGLWTPGGDEQGYQLGLRIRSGAK